MVPNLSNRGAENSSPPEENDIWEVISNLWDEHSNPDGYVSLGVAENALMHDDLCKFLNKQTLVEERSLTYGDGPSGSKRLKSALASFLNNYFRPVSPVKSDQLFVTNGVSSAIEHASWALANPGDGILLGKPYYRAFLPDISLRTGVETVSVSFGDVDPCGLDCVSKYEKALLESNEKGVKIRALMLCHPHNPLGKCYTRGTIIAIMRLCQKHNVHFISDEIYALSVWKNEVDTQDTKPVGFESVLSINTEGIIDPRLVHCLWGTSKDFGANGIRVGVIVSQSNPGFLRACGACSIYSSPSSIAENAVVSILEDHDFLFSYIEKNQARLSAAYSYAVQVLQRHGLEHAPGATAAFFLWVNLGKKYLEQNPQCVEHEDPHAITDIIYQLLMQKKVYIVSGDEAGAEEPGWFRIVFTQPKDLIEEGVKRISEALNERASKLIMHPAPHM